MDNLQKDIKGSSYIDISAMTRNFIKALRQLGWIIPLLAMTGGAMFYIRSMRSYVPVYTSKGTFAVSVSSEESASSSSGYYNNAAASQMAKTYKYLLTSSIVKNIISKDSGPVQASITADVADETNLMIIRATASDPRKAYEAVKAVLDNYSQISDIVQYNAQMVIIEEPVVSNQPVNSPSFMSSAKKGALGGGAVGLIMIIAFSAIRRSIYKSEDTRNELNLACIGIIPEVMVKKRSRKRKQRILITDEKTGFGFRESVRALRTKIETSMKDRKRKVILVTSALPSEGKTSVAINLALSLAQNGKSVALIDGDLRNPSVIKELGTPGVQKLQGISDVLEGKAKLREALFQVEDTGLTVLGGAESVDDASEKLGSEIMKNIIEELLRSNEYIIVDTPPAGLMADAAVLARCSDGIILVVRQGYARISSIIEAGENLSGSRASVIGCVLNRVKGGADDLGYGRYGKYGSYGGYGGYGNYREEKEKTS